MFHCVVLLLKSICTIVRDYLCFCVTPAGWFLTRDHEILKSCPSLLQVYEMAVLCVWAMIEDESSVCFRVDSYLSHIWQWMMSFAEVFYLNYPFVGLYGPPFAPCIWETRSLLGPAVQRKLCLVPSRSLMSSFTENMYVIFCSWKRGPYAFYITLSYFWVDEKQGLLDHSQSDITLRSGWDWIFLPMLPSTDSNILQTHHVF